MASLKNLEALPKFKLAVRSIYCELGESFNKHATEMNLSRHVDKNDRQDVRFTVRMFVKCGYLRHHRTDTFCWTAQGLEYAKRIIRQDQL